MQTYLDCIPCFFRQTLEAARIAGVDSKIQKQILDELAGLIPSFSMEDPPPLMAQQIHRKIKQLTGNPDPYKELKNTSNQISLAIYDRLKDRIKKAEDPMRLAVELAILGNILDFGAMVNLDLDGEVLNILNLQNFENRLNPSFFDYSDFNQKLQSANHILYLADNAGEIVFDRLLMEEILFQYPGKSLVCAVKSKPIINDVTISDLTNIGLDSLCSILPNGTDIPGTVLSQCSDEFLNQFNRADLIISKGQGNFESLSGVHQPIFYLFMAKCEMVARHVGCQRGTVLLINGNREHESNIH